MARSDDILKKYGVTQVTGGSGKTASSSGNNSTGSPNSILDKYGVSQVRGGKTYDAEKIRDWFIGTSSALQSGSQYLSQDGYRKPNTSFSSVYEKYMDDADDVARFIEDNKSSMENYGDVLDMYNKSVSYLRKINSNIQKSNEFFSQFSGEDEYNKWNAYSTPENRQKRYAENQQKLEELKQKRQDSYVYQPGQNPYLSGGSSSGTGYAASQQGVDTARGNLSPEERKELDKQIQAIETEMRMYERGLTDSDGFYYGYKVADDYRDVLSKTDFSNVSSVRDSKNPTRDDLDMYDIMTNADSWYTDADGNTFDAFGNRIDTSNTDDKGNILHPIANEYSVKDRLGMYLSTTDSEREEAYADPANEGTWASVIKDGVDGNWELLDYNEVRIYYYLLNSSGQEAADKYLSDMKTELNRRNAMTETKNLKKAFDEASVLERVALSVATTPAQLFSSAAGFIEDAANTMMGNDINPYSAAHGGMRFSNTVRSSQSEAIDKATGGFAIPFINFSFGDAYQAGMSALDMAVGGRLGAGAYEVLMGMGAATSEAQKLYKQGASNSQITFGAALAGAAEIVFEHASIENLINLKDPETIGQAVKNLLIQGGIEASEEGFTEIANTITNALVMGDDSDWSNLVRENNGNYKQAFLDKVSEVGNAMMGGFVSGVVGAGNENTLSYAGQLVQNQKTGEYINRSGDANAKLMALALEKADEVSGRSQKNIRSQVNALTEDRFVTQGGRNRATGRLYRTVQNVVTEQNIGEISAALQENGISKKEAKKIAGAYAVAANGIELSADQQKLLRKYADNEDVKSAIEKVVGDPESGVNKRAQSMMNFEFDTILSQIESTMQQAAPGQDNASSMDNLSAQKNEPQTASYDVSEDGETHLISDPGKTVSVSGFASIDNGKAMLQLSDGSVVDAEDVSFGKSSDALVYSVVADMGVPISTENSIVHAFDPGKGVSAQMYAYGIQEAYNMGKRNEQLQNTENDPYAQAMKLAWNEGRITSIKESKTAQKAVNDNFRKAKESILESGKEETSEHRAVLEEGITALSLNESQKASYNLADRIARAAKVDIIVYVGKTGENGYYDPKTDTIHLNLNAMNKNRMSMMAFTLGHELGHRAKKGSPEKFRAFADFLMEQYGKQGSDVNAMIAQEMAAAKEYGVDMTRDEAFEEVVCDACQRMLLDTDAGKKLARFGAESSQNKSIVSQIRRWISEFIEKLREIFAGVEPDSLAAQEFAKFDAGVKQILADMYVDMTIDAGEHLSTIQNALGTGTTVKANENGEFTMAKSKDGSKKVFNLQTWNNGGRETLEATLLREGYTREEVDAALTIMDGKQKLVEAIANEVDGNGKPAFPEQGRINEATLTTDIKDGHAVLSALVSNGDYPVNIDLLMVCKKRKAYQRVINRLCETGMIKQATVDALAIAQINKILGKYGFETACLGCFVESRRLRIQEWAQTIVREWNGEVKKRNPNAKSFGFGKGEATLTSEEVMQLIGELESGGKKNEQGNLNLGQGSAVKRMGVLLDKVPSLRRTLSVEDLITPDGLSALRRFDGNLFSIVKSRYGSNSPKFVQEFNPYNSEIAKYGKVPNEYNSLREYLYAIGGARMQSFSDFIVENWFDYCQIVADLSARKLPMHTYTKEISLAKLFGMTGIKINMSLIPDIDRSLGREYAGLTRNENGDLELIWADKDRFKATGGKSYMQSINFADAIALQNDPRYSANVGTIAVGISDMHIRMMLNDPRIRMVIPYHSSGMNPIYADMMGTSYYKDYTNFQNTTVKQLYDSNGNPVSVKLDKTQTGKLTGGFQFDEVLHDLGDARAAAESYKEWCKNASLHTITINGETYTAELTPKFSQFAEEQNYYKLLEDFNTYDCITEEAAPQVDVQQVYPDGFEDILRAELSSQERYRQKQEKNQAFDKAMGEIESYLQNHTKADTVYYANQHGINLGAKDKKLNAADKAKLKQMQNDGKAFSLPKTDSDGNQLSEDHQEFFADSKARDENGNLYVMYHGSRSPVFTEFDMQEGVWLTPDQRYAEVYADMWHSWRDESKARSGLEQSVYADPDYRLYKMYANITNPLDLGEINDEFDRSQMTRLAKLLGVPTSRIRSLAYDRYGDQTVAFVYQVTKQKEFIDIAREKGYDGFTATEKGTKTFCAFGSPNQVKLTSNEVPSSFSDIRYSLPKSSNPYSYEELTRKPDMVVTTVGGNVPSNRADVIFQAKKNASSVGRFDPNTGNVIIHVNDIHTDVVIGRDGLKHSMDRRFNVNAPVVLKAGEILANSIRINELTPKSADASESYVLIGAAKNGNGDLYIVRSVVNRFSDELTSMDVLYAINAKKEPAALLPLSTEKPALGTDSKTSISDLLDYVNRYFPDILPEEVLKHYGYDSRPDGVLGKDALYKLPVGEDTSPRALLANAFDELAKTDAEKESIRKYQERVVQFQELETKLKDLRTQIRELYTADGKLDTKKIRELQFEVNATANRIETLDRMLLRTESAQQFKNVLKREQDQARSREIKKAKDAVIAFRHDASAEIRETMRDYEAVRSALVGRDSDMDIIEREFLRVVKEYEKEKRSGEKKEESLRISLDKESKKHQKDNDLWEREFNRMLRQYEKSADYIGVLERRVDKAKQVRDNAAKRDAVGKLQKLVLDTTNWIAYPGKKDVKCPDLLKKPYSDFLNSIDLSSKRLASGGDPTKNDLKLASSMGSLATALERITMAQDPGQDAETPLDSGYLDLPAGFVQTLREMTEKIKDMIPEGEFVVSTMTADDVKQLSKMIRTLNHAIREMSTLYANSRFANVEELSGESMSFMDSLGEIEKTSGMANFVKWDNVLPYYAFKRFGSGGESVFEGLMDAQDKLAFLAQKIFDFQKATWTGDEAKSWGEDTHTINLPSGGTLTLTTADAMSIYCLSRRAQGLQHLLGGGVRVMGIKKGSTTAKDSRSTLSIQDIDAINSSLTDKQKKVAEAIQDFMSTVCAEWGNEISMKRFLTREFTEKFYFPIESNDENLTTKDPIAQQSDLFRLLNISATKPLNKYANNEVIIRNIFDVFSGHASDMARLNAFGMPLLDYMKWMNYREKSVNEDGQVTVRGVRKSMEKAFGNAAKSYVLNLIKDVNGRPSDGGDPNILMKWMRSAKTAAVGNSARVAMLQMTSYPRAALVLSPKSLTLGLTKKPNIDRAMKYCGIALWKSFGFYDTNISRTIEEQMKGVKDVKQKIIELSLKGAEIGDALTWGALWNACEYEVASNTKNKVGSEEFYQDVGKKMREVVYSTQVVDSTLTRSQIMRSKRGMAQEAAAFMSEPTLSANILMDAGYQFSMEKRRTGSAQAAWAKTGKYVGRAIAVYSIGQITAAIFEAFFDAWRDDDDEEYVEKYKAALIENLVLDIVPFNKMPVISDVFEALISTMGVGFYSSDRLSTTWITQSVDAYNTWKKVLTNNSSATVYNALYKTTRAISSATGISIAGAMREVVTLWNATAGAYDTTLKIRTWDNSKSEWAGQLLDALVSGNDRRAESLRKKFGDEDDLESAMRSAIKTRYESGEIDYETACKYLMLYGGQDRDEAHWKVEEWKFERENIGEDYEKYGAFYEAVRTGKNLKSIIKEYTDNGVTESTLRSQITSHFKPEYTGMTAGERANIKGYILNAMTATGKSREDAEEEMKLWDFEADYGFEYSERDEAFAAGKISTEEMRKLYLANGNTEEETELLLKANKWIKDNKRTDLSASTVVAYVKPLTGLGYSMSDTGMDIDDFLEEKKYIYSIESDKDKNGDAIAYSRINKAYPYIDSLPLTSEQKTALAVSCGWKLSTVLKNKLW